MKAAVLDQPAPIEGGPLSLREVPLPEPVGDRVLVRVLACGVCHTDLHTVEGELKLPRLPLIPGHQVVGVVEAGGPEGHRFAVGDRVGVPWLHSTCGRCEYCESGRENLCDDARFTGLHVDGGYAEYMTVGQDFAYAVPADASPASLAPLLCAGTIGYRALRLSDIRPGGRLGLYGFGASAYLALQIARHRGCEVWVFTRSQDHRRLATELGASWVGGAEEDPPGQLHSAIIFAPAGWLVREALRVLRKGGTLALAGIHMTPLPELDYALLYGERTIRSVANSTREDAEGLLAAAVEVPLRTEVETFRLEEANEALLRLKRSEIRAAAVLEVAPA